MMRYWLATLALLVSLSSAAAERVVSLAPSLSEIILELDAADVLVGMLDGGARPAELARVPSVGRFGLLELETLLSLKPDLILLWPDSVPRSVRAQLEQFGIALYVAEPSSLDQLADQFAEIGERVGRPEQGRELQKRFSQGMAELRQRYARERPLEVFYQVWDKPLYTIGGGQIISDALTVCGAHNIFADLTLSAPQIGVETILKRNPEVIIGGSGAELVIWQAWSQLKAVRLQQLWTVPDKGLERPSFQMLAATEKLCRLLAQAK